LSMNGLWYAMPCTPVRAVLGRPRYCGLGRRLGPTRVGQPDTARFACAGMSRTANLTDATDGTPDNPQRIDAIARYSCS
jgi:hypothetical protein